MEHGTTTLSCNGLTFTNIFGPTLSREETLEWIKMDAAVYKHFLSFPSSEQERLESFLSELLGEPVHIEKILPREGLRMAEEASIIIMDILVQLSNGSRVNVEMQKLGIYFPGERSSCYIADAIMRQYTELKNSLKDDFSYKKMKPFYLVVLMEQSSGPFKKVAPHYIHTKQISYDSGAIVSSLAGIKYISLDTFRQTVHNIDNKLQAWLTFFSSDEPADIIALITAYPEFRELYEEIAEFRTNPKELINMYSEALAVADRNTIRLMIDDMQDELASLTQQVADKTNEVAEKDNEIAEKDNEIAEKDNEIARLKAELAQLKSLKL